MSDNRDPSAGPVRGALTIYEAAECRPLWLEWAMQTQNPDLDLSGVVEFDTAGVQLLELVARQLASRQSSLKIEKASAVVIEVLKTYGLSARYGLSSAHA